MLIRNTYRIISKWSTPLLHFSLLRREKRGKEDPLRVKERQGITDKARPNGKLIWLHAASVGEAQSALILIHSLNKRLSKPVNFLVTTGTKTSANLMKDKLPQNAIHQYAAWDHPKWVAAFLDHWNPTIAFWMESELWPNTLIEMKRRDIPCALINARMSGNSFRNWKRFKSSAQLILSSFDKILCQTEEHKSYFSDLGFKNALVTDNLKYSATPLSFDKSKLNDLKIKVNNRPTWVYASSHKGEETLACQVHKELKQHLPNVLTIIVPRHPERRDAIVNDCEKESVSVQLRTKSPLPSQDIDIFVADTLGELGLFYALSDIAVIGRSFSDDGGGGHNPIEASLLNCAVLSGPLHQNQQQLFDDMQKKNAVRIVQNKKDLSNHILNLLNDDDDRNSLIKNGEDFSKTKSNVINYVMDELEPLFTQNNMAYK